MSYKYAFIKDAIAKRPATKDELFKLLRKHLKNEKNRTVPNTSTLLQAYRELIKEKAIAVTPWLEQLLIKRAVRTLSGVAPLHVMTAPLGCPANCLYCPNEPGMPKSYLSNQPGAMRAILNDFDPYRQVTMRLRALYQNGHFPEKIELIENGGTWTALPRRYRIWFITRCYQAANAFNPELFLNTTDFIPDKNPSLRVLNRLNNQPDHLQKDSLRLQDDDTDDLLTEMFAAQKMNETATHRIIGITIETRPDWLADDEILHLRQIGCTKIEIGVQSIDETVLKWNNRGHGVQAVIDATQRMRDAGFKVGYHIMPAMFKATPEGDIKMFHDLFANPAFKPDFLKVYPCVVVKGAPLYKLWERGDFVPYDADTLLETLVEICKTFPRYCRVARFIRDIPSESIWGGNKMTNLREVVEKELAKRGVILQDIRYREIKGGTKDTEVVMNTDAYDTINGKEYFISFDGKHDDKLYAFIRLRLPQTTADVVKNALPELEGCALIREVHTYGKLARLDNDTDKTKTQHKGLGKQLMEEAEKIAREQGYKKMAVIAGIGTREYYRKFGYQLEGTYMVKGM